jgi:hypothetical protein
MEIELLLEIVAMDLRGLRADTKLLRDILARGTLSDQPQYLAFPLRTAERLPSRKRSSK